MIDQSSSFSDSIDSKIGVDHDELVDVDDELADSDNEIESSSDLITKEAEEDDDNNVNYMVGKEVLSYRRIKADLKASRRLRKKYQAKLKTMKAWSNLSSSVTPSKSTSSSSPASSLSSIPPSSSSQHLSSLSLPLSIIERNSWTILTDLSVLKSNGYRGQYYRKKLQLPLPVKFRTPR